MLRRTYTRVVEVGWVAVDGKSNGVACGSTDGRSRTRHRGVVAANIIRGNIRHLMSRRKSASRHEELK